MCVLPWIIEREELDWKSAFMPLNAGFTSSMPLLRTVMSKSCCFGHTQVQARLNGTRGELPCGTRSIGGQVNFFLTAQAYAFIYDSEAKLTTLGIHWLKADPMEQEVSPEQSLCGIRGTTKKTSETHIQSNAVPTLHALGTEWHVRFQSSSPCSIIHGTTQACKHIHFQKQI